MCVHMCLEDRGQQWEFSSIAFYLSFWVSDLPREAVLQL